MYVLLKAMGIGAGDEVILQGYTCCVVPKALLLTGVKPVYVDVNPSDYSISYESLAKKVSEKTRAIIVQHSFGIPCTCTDDVRELCDEKGILMIEDCAHSLGISYHGKLTGTIGDASFFSTDHSKIMSTSIGGFLVVNKESIANKVSKEYEKVPDLKREEARAVSTQLLGEKIRYGKFMYWLLNSNKYIHYADYYFSRFIHKIRKQFYMNDYSNVQQPEYTFPARLSNAQAYVGVSQLKRLRKNLEERRQTASIFSEHLNSKFIAPHSEAYLVYPVRVESIEIVQTKLKNTATVESMFHVPLGGAKENELSKYGYDVSECPTAIGLCKHVINLPCINISKSDVLRICKVINEFG